MIAGQYGAVHQFHSGAAYGDAVTQQMLYIRSQLSSMGYESEIYAEHIDPALGGEIRRVNTYSPAPDGLLILHHSMGYEAFDELFEMRHEMLVMYHNITPEVYFDDPVTKYYARLGREQIRQLGRKAKVALAASNYNRKELLGMGFNRVDVLPARVDYSRFFALDRGRATDDWVFVGRLAPNKCQHELVRAFATHVDDFERGSKLWLVGDTSDRTYTNRVRHEAESLGVADRVFLTGKVPEDELCGILHRAGLYVSLSEHEGFGVPLLEAMAAGLPVVAFAAAAVPETLGGAGFLIREKDARSVAIEAERILSDSDLRELLVAQQFKRVEKVQGFDSIGILSRAIEAKRADGRRVEIQVQGPFETSYSLAIVNRKLAMSLDQLDELNVSLYATEGPGDYEPKAQDLAMVPETRKHYERGKAVPYPDVVIRQMWPPRVIDSPGGITCCCFPWEESLVPTNIVEEFNRYADGVGAPSRFVEQALRRSGLTVPIGVVGYGVDRPDPAARCQDPEVANLRSFRFLHISSAFPRKGVDALLQAYFSEFDGDSDVSLILKTFPNPHNTVGELLERLQGAHPNPPDVRWIDRDLPEREIHGLYNLADCYVHCARGEGFGLPVAEAMLAGVPVIATPYSGLADFVSDETAITVKFRLTDAASHVGTTGSMWAEPDMEDLGAALQRVIAERGKSASKERTDNARKLIEERFSWNATANRWMDLLTEIKVGLDQPRVGIISTWNSRCGIAEYSQYLMRAMPAGLDYEVYANRWVEVVDPAKERRVVRCWWDRYTPDLSRLESEIVLSDPDVVHLQFNFGFFELERLAGFIDRQVDQRGVVLTLHRTSPALIQGKEVSLADISDSLSRADRLIVHQPVDVASLESMGLTSNVELIEHGVNAPPSLDPETVREGLGLGDRRVLATFGFLLPHKGTMKLVELVDEMRSEFPDLFLLALCSIHPDPSSPQFEVIVREEIARRNLENHVRLVTDYLPDELALTILRGAEVILLPYDSTPESASGAARFVLPAERPIVATDLPIFGDFGEAVLRVPPGDQTALRNAVTRLLQDPNLAAALVRESSARAVQASWGAVAARHLAVYREASTASKERRQIARQMGFVTDGWRSA